MARVRTRRALALKIQSSWRISEPDRFKKLIIRKIRRS